MGFSRIVGPDFIINWADATTKEVQLFIHVLGRVAINKKWKENSLLEQRLDTESPLLKKEKGGAWNSCYHVGVERR